MSYVQFDVMRKDFFVGTFRMPYNALSDKPKPEDLLEYLYERRPTLRYCSKELSIFVDNVENDDLFNEKKERLC